MSICRDRVPLSHTRLLTSPVWCGPSWNTTSTLRPHLRTPMSSKVTKVVRITVFYLAILAVWQGIAYAEIWPSYIFPSPLSVLDSLIAYIQNGLVFEAIQISLTRLA